MGGRPKTYDLSIFDRKSRKILASKFQQFVPEKSPFPEKESPGTPRPTIYKWMFQWDDSKSLYRNWLFHHLHPFINGWPWGSRVVFQPSFALAGPWNLPGHFSTTKVVFRLAPFSTSMIFGKRRKNTPWNWQTVDGQNPAPPRMMIIPLFIGF